MLLNNALLGESTNNLPAHPARAHTHVPLYYDVTPAYMTSQEEKHPVHSQLRRYKHLKALLSSPSSDQEGSSPVDLGASLDMSLSSNQFFRIANGALIPELSKTLIPEPPKTTEPFHTVPRGTEQTGVSGLDHVGTSRAVVGEERSGYAGLLFPVKDAFLTTAFSAKKGVPTNVEGSKGRNVEGSKGTNVEGSKGMSGTTGRKASGVRTDRPAGAAGANFGAGPKPTVASTVDNGSAISAANLVSTGQTARKAPGHVDDNRIANKDKRARPPGISTVSQEKPTTATQAKQDNLTTAAQSKKTTLALATSPSAPGRELTLTLSPEPSDRPETLYWSGETAGQACGRIEAWLAAGRAQNGRPADLRVRR